jgi:hypothetical protein
MMSVNADAHSHSIIFADVFVGCHTIFLSTKPNVTFVVYNAPASVKWANVSSCALGDSDGKVQSCGIYFDRQGT